MPNWFEYTCVYNIDCTLMAKSHYMQILNALFSFACVSKVLISKDGRKGLFIFCYVKMFNFRRNYWVDQNWNIHKRHVRAWNFQSTYSPLMHCIHWGDTFHCAYVLLATCNMRGVYQWGLKFFLHVPTSPYITQDLPWWSTMIGDPTWGSWWPRYVFYRLGCNR